VNRFHSVILDEDACKGCTVCVTTCPTEAIRVRNGKARITSERCIDCGECIRRCPHHAKKPLADSFAAFPDAWRGRFDLLVALPAPSLYGQFPVKFGIERIHEGLRALGFDAVFPVAAATPALSTATRNLIRDNGEKGVTGPLISSSCPTVVKYVQIRFPTLLENLATVIAPMELAGRMAKRTFSDPASLPAGEKTPRVGCFFISPCAGKITEAMAPIGGETSAVDAVFPMTEAHLPLLQSMIKNARGDGFLGNRRDDLCRVALPNAAEISWGRSGGEADTTLSPESGRSLSVDGMEQCVKILEAAEDGKLAGIDFLELMACPGGCTGGPLTACNTALARHHLRERERIISSQAGASAESENPERNGLLEQTGDYAVRINHGGGEDCRTLLPETPCESCQRSLPFPARPALRLDPDFAVAMNMMKRMDEIRESLPGIDCGCCGAPNCQALAEDIVKGTGARTDCVIIMKEEYRELLEQRWQSGE